MRIRIRYCTRQVIAVIKELRSHQENRSWVQSGPAGSVARHCSFAGALIVSRIIENVSPTDHVNEACSSPF